MPSARHITLCVLLVLGPAFVSAQPPPTGAFIVRLGTDTTAVERFNRMGSTYNIEQVLRSPRTSWRHTHLELTPAGEIGTIFLMLHQIGSRPDAPLLGSTTLTSKGGDTAVVETRQGSSTGARSVAVRPGLIPSLPQSFLPYELTAMRMRATRADSMTVALLGASGDTMPVIVRRMGSDSMTFTLPFLTYRARVDADGRILSLAQALGTSVERVSNVDIDGLAKTWAALDEQGKGMGPLSPADSVSASIGGAHLTVHYGRPRMRGRTIFGYLVPWDGVWRTGAGDATVFATDRDLVVGGVPVPAGRYSLFTLISRAGTTLILNKETERNGARLQGTEHDPRHDLVRVNMATASLASPVDQFSISVVPHGTQQAELRLEWERRQMTVPIQVK